MDRKGQLDQTITTVIVLFIAFFLCAIFIIVSGNIGNVRGSNSGIEAPVITIANSQSEVLYGLFLTDFVTLTSGSTISVQEALLRVNRSVWEKKWSDHEGFESLSALNNLFLKKYSCDSGNQLFLLVKDPSASAAKGKYGMYLSIPHDSFSSTDLYPKRSVNIVDLVNDRLSRPADYAKPEYSFIDGLEMPVRGDYHVYPRNVDLLNTWPDFIVVIKGVRTC